MQVAYSNKDRREQAETDAGETEAVYQPKPLYPAAKKGRKIPGQTFVFDNKYVPGRKPERLITIGQIEKSHCSAVRVCIFHWRGKTQIEILDCERLLYDFSIGGADRAPISLDIKHIDELIALLEQARQRARLLSSQK